MTSRFETFSFLPALTPNQVRDQAEDMLTKGFMPLVEYLESPNFEDIYWKNWPLPEKEDITGSWLVSQVDACARRNPYAFIRLSGYDPTRKVYGHSFVIKTPMEGA